MSGIINSVGIRSGVIGTTVLETVTTADINGGTLAAITIDGNWTAASQTCANLGTVTTADINGGTWQGTIDGAWTAASQTCANLGTVDAANLSNVDIVYPAGSIAQIQFMDIVWAGDVSQSTTAAKLYNGTTTRINMTLRTANAKVIGFATNSTSYVGGGTVYGEVYLAAKTGADSLASAPSGHSTSVKTRYKGVNYKPFNITMSGAIALSNSIDDVFCFAPAFNSDGAGNWYVNSDAANSRGHFWVAEIYQ